MAGAKLLACMAARKDRQKEKWERKGRKEWNGREKGEKGKWGHIRGKGKGRETWGWGWGVGTRHQRPTPETTFF